MNQLQIPYIAINVSKFKTIAINCRYLCIYKSLVLQNQLAKLIINNLYLTNISNWTIAKYYVGVHDRW